MFASSPASYFVLAIACLVPVLYDGRRGQPQIYILYSTMDSENFLRNCLNSSFYIFEEWRNKNVTNKLWKGYHYRSVAFVKLSYNLYVGFERHIGEDFCAEGLATKISTLCTSKWIFLVRQLYTFETGNSSLKIAFDPE